ncbi:MAG: divergent polysaccharide deacetylase family protein [Alphaproteobacteria bacterium]|nr:divergent polysaccharide deacetylase family protein [Alphaproteobacteria bacterium]
MAALLAARARLRPFLPGAALVAVGFLAGWLVGIAGGEHAPSALPVHGPPEPMASQGMAAPYVPVTPERVAAAMAPLPGTPAYRYRAHKVAAPFAMGLPQVPAIGPDRAPDAEVDAAPAQPAGPPLPRVAILIDDMGLLEEATRKAIALDPAVSMAFLPYARNSAALAREALAAGHRVLLHMPMEPAGVADPGPDALLVGMAPAEIRLRLAKAFDSVPGAIGLNNHMGSRFTSDASAMASVIDVVASRGVMILDSMTTPDSVVGQLARPLGVPSGARDVFLDNDRDPAAIARQFAEAERIAQRTGLAVAIGHPYDETIEAIARWLPQARARGIEPVPIDFAAKPALTITAQVR